MRETKIETMLSVNTFVPDDRMLKTKLKLQRSVPPPVLARITESSLDTLREHLGDDTIDIVMAWCKREPEFLEWLVSPDEFDLELYKARRKAVSVVTETLDLDVVDQEGKTDAKLAALRYKAAQDILSKDPMGQQKSTTNYNYNNKVSVVKRQPPKVLASKTVDQLEAQFQKLDLDTGDGL
jgi:hypothetical protein